MRVAELEYHQEPTLAILAEGLRFSIHLLIVVHHSAMVLPFEVKCSLHDLYFILLVLRKAPGGQKLKVHESVLGNILDYIKYCRFGDLQEAVFACLAARRNEVRLVRNVTLPARLPQCIIPGNETVRLS